MHSMIIAVSTNGAAACCEAELSVGPTPALGMLLLPQLPQLQPPLPLKSRRPF
jgi:hypothetical protein